MYKPSQRFRWAWLLAELACEQLFLAARLALYGTIVQTLHLSTLQYAHFCFVAGRRPLASITLMFCDFSQVTYLQQRLPACVWTCSPVAREAAGGKARAAWPRVEAVCVACAVAEAACEELRFASGAAVPVWCSSKSTASAACGRVQA